MTKKMKLRGISPILFLLEQQVSDTRPKHEGGASKTEPVIRTPDTFIAVGVSCEALFLILAGHLLSPMIWDRTLDRMLLPYIAATVMISVGFVGLFALRGGYRYASWLSSAYNSRRLIEAWTSVWLAALALGFIFKISEEFSRLWALGWFIIGGVGVGLLHFYLSRLVKKAAHAGRIAQRVAIYGAGAEGAPILQALEMSDSPFLRVEGVYDDRAITRSPIVLDRRTVTGNTRRLIEDILSRKIDIVLLALPMAREERLQELMCILEQVAVEVRLVPSSHWHGLGKGSLKALGSVPTLALWEPPFRTSDALFKWGIDKIVASTAVLMLSPVLALIASAIKLESDGPVLFRQRRFGFNNEAIEVLKFRTMYIDKADVTGAVRTVKNDPRVTTIGRVLRRLSLDELPQLFNVLRGDMSLVGPRPHAVMMKVGSQYYFEAVSGYAARHRVKPGITGLAQVNGARGEVCTLECAKRRIQLDLEYLNNWSLGLDIQILIKTLFIVIRQSSAY
ncbi:MAG: undecaprenyl-phosphate glucose phosphotransferase [Nitrococcus sp.]|nr:undecaprenyl-phosphate glucose phosphotransferase [Nitrococcus sp.]